MGVTIAEREFGELVVVPGDEFRYVGVCLSDG